MRKWSRSYALLFLSFSLLMLTSSVSAQPNSSGQDSGKEVIQELDNATWVSDVSWSGENTTFKIYSEIPKPITITDVNSIKTSGGGSFKFKTVTLNSGVNTVTMNLDNKGEDKTVTITDQNNGIYVSNPEKPFFLTIVAADLYIVPWVIAAMLIAFAFLIIKWREFKIGKSLRRIG